MMELEQKAGRLLVAPTDNIGEVAAVLEDYNQALLAVRTVISSPPTNASSSRYAEQYEKLKQRWEPARILLKSIVAGGERPSVADLVDRLAALDVVGWQQVADGVRSAEWLRGEIRALEQKVSELHPAPCRLMTATCWLRWTTD